MYGTTKAPFSGIKLSDSITLKTALTKVSRVLSRIPNARIVVWSGKRHVIHGSKPKLQHNMKLLNPAEVENMYHPKMR